MTVNPYRALLAAYPACGLVPLRPAEVELRVDRTAAGDSYYAFTCPSCVTAVRKPADQRVVRLLLSVGVVAATTRRGGSPPGPAIGYDDLLDFHALLRSDDWFDRLRQLTGERRAGDE